MKFKFIQAPVVPSLRVAVRRLVWPRGQPPPQSVHAHPPPKPREERRRKEIPCFCAAQFRKERRGKRRGNSGKKQVSCVFGTFLDFILHPLQSKPPPPQDDEVIARVPGGRDYSRNVLEAERRGLPVIPFFNGSPVKSPPPPPIPPVPSNNNLEEGEKGLEVHRQRLRFQSLPGEGASNRAPPPPPPSMLAIPLNAATKQQSSLYLPMAVPSKNLPPPFNVV